MKKSRLALIILCIAMLTVCFGAAACTGDDADVYVRLAGKFVFLDEPTYDLSSGLILQSQTMELFTDYTLKTTIEYFNTLTSRFENTTMEGMYFYFEGENVITIAYNDLGSATYPFDGAKIDLPNCSLYLFEANSNGELQGNFHTITYNTTSGGSIRGATIQYVGHGGSTRPVSAIPDSGYEFAGWSDGVSSADRQETNVTSSKTITAQFETSYILTYIAGAGGSIVGAGGSISSEISQQVMPGEISAFPVTALPDYGYKFTGWSDGLTTAQRRDKNVISDLTVTANFAKAVNCDHVSLNEGEYCPECGMECYLRSDDDLLMKFDGSSNLYREIYGATATSVFNDYRYNIVNVKLSDNVTQIADSAFSSYSRISSIIIPNSVTSIGAEAFSRCSGLTSITIPDSVTSIGNSAFYWCRSLTSITIPDSVTSIGAEAFSGCYDLTSITIPFVGSGDSSNTHFGYIFGASSYVNNRGYVPSSLTEVIITGGSSIEDYAFADCSGLTSVIIGGSVISIGSNAFYRCDSLTSITIPDSVTSIGSNAFYGCDSLASITIPDSVTSIGSNAFYGCDSLASITIPNSVTSIGNYAFSYCSSLASITILPDGVTSIGDSAFRGCGNLTSITIPDSVTSIGNYAFYGCSSLASITILPDGVTSIGDYAFADCSGLTSVTIGGSVTSIGAKAFSSCHGLTSITIPDSVTSIGNYAFSYCNVLTIYCEAESKPGGWSSSWNYSNCPVVWNCNNNESDNDGNIYYIAESGIRYALNNGTATVIRQSTTLSGEIIIPGEITYKDVAYSVTTINGSAFYYCSGLTSITIPDSVTTINGYAFLGCSGLTSITVPDSVTSIGWFAFEGCSGLTSITIGGSVSIIGDCAFRGCNGLTSIAIPDSVTSIGKDAFKGCSGLESITVEQGNTIYHSAGNCIIETASKTLILGCQNSIIPNDGSVTSIRGSAFYGCSGLTSITIPDSVTSIGAEAFYGCSGLTSITIPDGVTSIGSNAFYGCSGLTSIAIPDSVTSIGYYAFSGCSGLRSITISDSVTSIGESAFSYCGGLESITVEQGNPNYHSAGNCLIETASKTLTAGCKNSVIPDDGSVISIGDYAFSGCSGLRSITIPDSVTSIGYSAFEDCSGLTSITLPDSVTNIGDYAFQDCSGLTSITIPNRVTSIGYRAFDDCSGLTSITIPDSVTSIGGYAFVGCGVLTIYCESESQPAGWSETWNWWSRPVVWGYKG